MTKEVVSSQLMKGGSGAVDQLPKIVRELSGYTISYVAGAAAGTKMDIAAMRAEDTLLAVIVGTDAGGAWANDVANCTIQSTKATGTITISGNPVADETVTVGGVVYTWKAAGNLTDLTHVKITAGDNTAMALALATAINAYESRYTGAYQNTPLVVASAAAGVVTITAVMDGAGNAPAVTNSANMAVTNNNTADVSATAVSVVNGNTLTVNGVVFTARTTPDLAIAQDVAVGGTNDIMATNMANAINRYQREKGSLNARAVAITNVCHIYPLDAAQGNIYPLVEASTNVAVSGATLTGGTATGGIKSTTNLASKSLVVHWLNKQ
jgi:hypothetical protein